MVKMSVSEMLPVVSAAATLIGIAASTASLAYWSGRKFMEIDLRFREIDRRFEAIDRRFEEIDKRFEDIDRRFEEVNRRLGEIDGRLAGLEKRISDAELRLGERIDKVDLKVRRLGEAFVSYQEFFVKYLVYEGALKPAAGDVVLAEARGLMRLATMNPFTKEEWKRLGELLDKSEKEGLTLSEANELLELARKAVREYGEYPEAWKLHIYASIMAGLAYKRMKEEGKH